MNMYPRAVYFNNGKAVGAGFCGESYPHDSMKVMELPSKHYDFIDYDVKSKTAEEIENDLRTV